MLGISYYGKSFDRVFGGNAVDIRPQGSTELIFGLKINSIDNPSLPEEQRKTTSFDFQEKIQMNVIGKIGDLFGKNDVSIESIVQLDASENKAEIVVITHEVSNGKFEKSKKEINALSEVELIASQLSCI